MNEYYVAFGVLAFGLILIVLTNRRHHPAPHRAPEALPNLMVRKPVRDASPGGRSALLAGLQAEARQDDQRRPQAAGEISAPQPAQPFGAAASMLRAAPRLGLGTENRAEPRLGAEKPRIFSLDAPPQLLRRPDAGAGPVLRFKTSQASRANSAQPDPQSGLTCPSDDPLTGQAADVALPAETTFVEPLADILQHPRAMEPKGQPSPASQDVPAEKSQTHSVEARAVIVDLRKEFIAEDHPAADLSSGEGASAWGPTSKPILDASGPADASPAVEPLEPVIPEAAQLPSEPDTPPDASKADASIPPEPEDAAAPGHMPPQDTAAAPSEQQTTAPTQPRFALNFDGLGDLEPEIRHLAPDHAADPQTDARFETGDAGIDTQFYDPEQGPRSPLAVAAAAPAEDAAPFAPKMQGIEAARSQVSNDVDFNEETPVINPATEDTVTWRDYSALPDETAVVEDFDPRHDVLMLPAHPMLAEYVQSGYLLTFEDGQNLLLAGLKDSEPPPVWEVHPSEADPAPVTLQ